MESEIPSRLERYCTNILDNQEHRLRAAAASTGASVSGRLDKATLLNAHAELIHKQQSMDPEKHDYRQSYIAAPYPPCSSALSTLEKIDINSLALETHHHGTVLIARLLVDPISVTCVATVIEDEFGVAERLAIFNQDEAINPSVLFPQGCVIAIKEPYLKASANSGCSIRIDHPANFLLLHPDDNRVPACWRPEAADTNSSQDYVDAGHDAYEKGEYHRCIEWFSQALSVEPNQDGSNACAVRRDRANAYLQIGLYEHANADAQEALRIEPDSSTGMFRKAWALYGMAKYDDCIDQLRGLVQIDREHADGWELLKVANARRREEMTGNYNWEEMRSQVSEGNIQLDKATFRKRVIRRETTEHGTGLFTTEDVKAGDLLLCEKAFSIELGGFGITLTDQLIDLNLERVTSGAIARLLPKVVQRAHLLPETGSSLLKLPAGPHSQTTAEAGQSVDGKHVIDSFILSSITSLNSISFPVFPVEEVLKSPTPGNESCGLWVLAASLRHACSSNSTRAFIGDMLVLRANRAIAAGEEITTAQIPLDQGVDSRCKKIRKLWGVECQCDQCSLCALELQSCASSRNGRRRLLARLRKAKSLVRIEKLLEELKYEYQEEIFTGQPKVELARAIYEKIFARKQVFAQLAREKIRMYAEDLVQAHGFVFVDGPPFAIDRRNGLPLFSCLAALLHLAHIHRAAGRRRVAGVFVREARLTYKIVFGEDESFKDRMLKDQLVYLREFV